MKSADETSAVLDHFIDGCDFVAGDQFTMGDIPIGGAIYRWYKMDSERPDRPNILKWYERLCEWSRARAPIRLNRIGALACLF